MSNQSFDSIVTAAQKQISALQQYDKEIDNQIIAIKDAEWNKPLTKSELARIKKLRADQISIQMAVEEIGYITLGALDKTDEVKRMANALAGVTKDLSARKASLEAIGKNLKKIGDVLAAIAGIAKKLNDLAASKSTA